MRDPVLEASVAVPTYEPRIGLAWWLVGMALVTLYFVIAYRRFAGKVSAGPEDGA